MTPGLEKRSQPRRENQQCTMGQPDGNNDGNNNNIINNTKWSYTISITYLIFILRFTRLSVQAHHH